MLIFYPIRLDVTEKRKQSLQKPGQVCVPPVEGLESAFLGVSNWIFNLCVCAYVCVVCVCVCCVCVCVVCECVFVCVHARACV